MKTTAYAYWAAFVAALGGFLQSYVTCSIAGAIRFIADEFSLAPLQEGNLASIILLGAITGSCLSGSPADKWGRKKCLVASALLFMICSIGVFFVQSYLALLAFRFMIGLAMGTTSILVPLYLAEIAPPKSRGAFVTLFQFSVTVGTMVAYLVNLFYEPTGDWRIMLALATFPAAFQLVSFLAFPESPKWLFGRGSFEKGNEVLYRLQGVRLEKAEPVKADQATWGSLLKPIFRKSLFIGILLSMFQQLSGINAIIYFTPKIFGEAGLTNAMFSTVLVGIINLVATFISIFLIDRWGRRKLLLWSQVGVALSLLVIATAFATESPWIDLIAAAAVLTFVGSYSLGMGPVTWVLISEIYPLSIRAKAMGMMTFLSWLSNYFVVLSFPLLVAELGSSHTFSLYFILASAALFLFWRFVPETKGKTLEELALLTSLLIGVFLPFSLTAFEGEVESKEKIKPWFTGPILASSGNIVPKGHFGTQPYILGVAQTAFYDNNWHSQPIETLSSLQFRTPVWCGLTSRIDFKVSPVWMWNYRNHQSHWTLGDWSAQLDFQLHQDTLPYKNWLPSIKIGIRETFPTGKYQKLNPNKLGTDAGGRGAYTTLFSLNASKIFHLSGFHFLSLRWNLAYSLPTSVHVKGFNKYGGGIGTDGTISPDRFFLALFAFEYSWARNWAICCDFSGAFASKITFKGTPGVMPAQDANINPRGLPVSNEAKASIQYTIAPGIEYNWSENLGLLAGVWLTLAGKNSSRFTTGVLSINYYH